MGVDLPMGGRGAILLSMTEQPGGENEVVPGLVELEVAVPRLTPALR